MHRSSPLPATGEVFLDARGTDRSLRVTWHREAGVVVLSLWRERTCAGTFRLAISEVPTLIAVLRAGLESAYDEARESLLASFGDDAVETGRGAYPVAREVC
jgi:hypothetical protein